MPTAAAAPAAAAAAAQPASAPPAPAPAAAPPAAGGAQYLRPHLLKLAPYTPIEPFEVLSQRFGRKPEDIIKLDANENPYGPPPEVLAALAGMSFPHVYPDPETRRLRGALAAMNDIPVEHLLVGAAGGCGRARACVTAGAGGSRLCTRHMWLQQQKPAACMGARMQSQGRTRHVVWWECCGQGLQPAHKNACVLWADRTRTHPRARRWAVARTS